MTRSLISFFSYNLPLSFRYHPLGPVVGLTLVLLWGFSFLKGFKPALILRHFDRRAGYAALIILVLWDLHRNGVFIN